MPAILDSPTRWITELTSETVSEKDFSRYSAYFDDLGVLYMPSSKTSATLPVEPPRSDTGFSEFETRPDFGNYFSQGDFSGGAGQKYFHRPTADKAGFFESEGFDISVPGQLTHLNSVEQILPLTFTAPTFLEEADDLPFVAQGTSVYAGNGSFPGSWTAESPGGTVEDLASRGDELFAALGSHGVHRRSSSGVWSHYQPDGATDLDTGTTTRVAWLKDRLFVVGAAGRSIYEVVADSTPAAIETLPEGWTFEGMFENGPYVFATAVAPTAGLSRVHTFGLNDDGSAIEKKVSTALPKGDLIYSGIGYLGRIFLGGGRQNSAGGTDPVLYEAIPDTDGSLQLLLLAEDDEGASENLAVRDFTALPQAVVFGWSRSDVNGHLRVGLGSYNLARNAFSYHLRDNAADSTEYVNSVIRYRGRLLFTAGDGFFHEDLEQPVPEATLVSSIGDWNNVGLKTWDLFQISHDPLVIQTSVEVEYTKKDPEEEDWEPAFTSQLPGALGAEERLEDIRSRAIAVKLTSTAFNDSAPIIRSFSVRSTPTPEVTEWTLTRMVRVMDRDRKDRRAEPTKVDVRAMRQVLQDLAYTWTTLYEPGITWIAYVQAVNEVEPGEAPTSTTTGSGDTEAFYLEFKLIARRAG